MYTLKSSSFFDSAHFLKGYEGKCANIHGHRWNVEIEVSAEVLQQEGAHRGMLVDFSDLKADLKGLTEALDHCLIVEAESLMPKTKEALLEEQFKLVELPFRPTAENLAKYFYENMRQAGYAVLRATVYETPKNCASYSEAV